MSEARNLDVDMMLINFESIYPRSSFANVESTMELLCPTCGSREKISFNSALVKDMLVPRG